MTVSQDFNPFAKQPVHILEVYRKDLDAYSSTSGIEKGSAAGREEKPFNRRIDCWLLAAALGASKNIYVPIDTGDRHRFIDGNILQRNLPAIEFMLLLAIAHAKDPFIVNKPREVLDIVEGYAAGGIPLIKEMIHEGHLTPQQNLTRCLIKELSSHSTSHV